MQLLNGLSEFYSTRPKHRVGWLLVMGTVLVTINQWRLLIRDRRQMAASYPKSAEFPVNDSLMPLVSILLPAWNEADHIDVCLQALVDLRYPHKQIIVCAGGKDDTLERACNYQGKDVIVLEQMPGEGKQRALRRCYEYAAGEVVYLTDADCVIDDHVFERTVAPVLCGTAAATGTWRPFEQQADDPFVQFQWSHHVIRELWMPELAPTLDGRNAAVARSVLDDVGAFDLDTPIGTDYVLSRMLAAGGYTIHFVRGSRIQTEYPDSLRTYMQQMSRWFRNPFILGRQWGDRALVNQVSWLALSSLMLLFSPLVMLAVRNRILGAAWLVGLLHLGLGAIRQGIVLSADEQTPALGLDRLLRFPTFLPFSWLATAKGLVTAMAPSRRWDW